jgi:hypothetical protein
MYLQEVVSRSSADISAAKKGAGAHVIGASHTGDPAERKARQEVTTASFQAGGPSSERPHEAPGDYVKIAMGATGCLCIPVVSRGLYFYHPYPYAV